jgi:hypothetical protein
MTFPYMHVLYPKLVHLHFSPFYLSLLIIPSASFSDLNYSLVLTWIKHAALTAFKDFGFTDL